MCQKLSFKKIDFMKFGNLFQEKGVIFIFCILAKQISKIIINKYIRKMKNKTLAISGDVVGFFLS